MNNMLTNLWMALSQRQKQPPIKSLIAQGTVISGDIEFTEGLRIDGEIKGSLQASLAQPSLLVISESAVVHGDVVADHVIINGTVVGSVNARVLLELQPKASIQGDVSYKAIEMHQGASISGQLKPVSQSESDRPVLKLAANNR
jgi:cytoskeletal protein CcmA (bactofilin family)